MKGLSALALVLFAAFAFMILLTPVFAVQDSFESRATLLTVNATGGGFSALLASGSRAVKSLKKENKKLHAIFWSLPFFKFILVGVWALTFIENENVILYRAALVVTFAVWIAWALTAFVIHLRAHHAF